MNLAQFTNRGAWRPFEADARAALALFRSWTDGVYLPRVPGCDTFLRLAWRLYHGRTVEQAAVREYLYRWRLALQRDRMATWPKGDSFGAPHSLGM